jgi:hypothetical protein
MKMLISLVFLSTFNFTNLFGQSTILQPASTLFENKVIIKPQSSIPTIEMRSSTPAEKAIRFFNHLNEFEGQLDASSKTVSLAGVNKLFFLTGSPLARALSIDNVQNIGIGTENPTTKLEINGFTKLGSDAPAIKIKKIMGTTPSAQGGNIDIDLGLNSTKIISIDVMVEYNLGSYVPSRYDLNPNYDFNWYCYPLNGTSFIYLVNKVGNSSQILSKPVKIIITYEE